MEHRIQKLNKFEKSNIILMKLLFNHILIFN